MDAAYRGIQCKTIYMHYQRNYDYWFDIVKSKLSSIKYIIAGSQVLDRQLMEQLQHICPDMEFILYYGASEA